jgi:hypothetical protein
MSEARRSFVTTVFHRLQVSADDINDMLCENINTIKKNMETLTEASKEVGLEMSAEKAKYILFIAIRMKEKIII